MANPWETLRDTFANQDPSADLSPGKNLYSPYTFYRSYSSRLSSKFIDAARQNDIATLKKLFWETPVNVNKRDSLGATALHYAARNGNKVIVEALLNIGADTRIKDTEGETAIDWVEEENNSIEIVELLTRRQSKWLDLNKANDNNNRVEEHSESECDTLQEALLNLEEEEESSSDDEDSRGSKMSI